MEMCSMCRPQSLIMNLDFTTLQSHAQKVGNLVIRLTSSGGWQNTLGTCKTVLVSFQGPHPAFITFLFAYGRAWGRGCSKTEYSTD